MKLLGLATSENATEVEMSLLHLEILMHYIGSRDLFPRDSVWIQHCHDEHEKAGLLSCEGGVLYSITDKGRVWLEKAASTPLPVQKWVFETE